MTMARYRSRILYVSALYNSLCEMSLYPSWIVHYSVRVYYICVYVCNAAYVKHNYLKLGQTCLTSHLYSICLFLLDGSILCQYEHVAYLASTYRAAWLNLKVYLCSYSQKKGVRERERDWRESV